MTLSSICHTWTKYIYLRIQEKDYWKLMCKVMPGKSQIVWRRLPGTFLWIAANVREWRLLHVKWLYCMAKTCVTYGHYIVIPSSFYAFKLSCVQCSRRICLGIYKGCLLEYHMTSSWNYHFNILSPVSLGLSQGNVYIHVCANYHV